MSVEVQVAGIGGAGKGTWPVVDGGVVATRAGLVDVGAVGVLGGGGRRAGRWRWLKENLA